MKTATSAGLEWVRSVLEKPQAFKVQIGWIGGHWSSIAQYGTFAEATAEMERRRGLTDCPLRVVSTWDRP